MVSQQTPKMSKENMEMKNMKKWSAVLSVVMLIALIIMAGCSKIEDVISEAEQQGTTTITKEDGKKITLSNKPDIPDLFPSDIPLPDEIQVISSISSDDSVTLGIETELPYDDVVQLYYDYAQKAGYSQVHRLEDQKFINYSAQRDTERFIFTLQLNLENNKTVYGSLIYSK